MFQPVCIFSHESESHSVAPNSLGPHGLCTSWNSLGQNTTVGSLSFLQGIFPTQGSNPGLLHCRQILYHLSYKGNLRYQGIRDTKGAFHAKMGTIKNRNCTELTEAEDIKKRWQEYTEELYKKDLHDPDNHDSVITHPEPDILECKVKWALGSITTNKASGGDKIPLVLFQILKVNAMKVLHSICPQIWKTQQSAQAWKRSVFILIQKKMQKKIQTTAQWYSFHTLAK